MKLELWYPVSPVSISQVFGVNGEWYQAHGVNIKGHNGVDFRTAHGQPIYASHDGWAYFEWDSSQGEGVVVRSDKKYILEDGTESYIKTIYWHMCDGTKEPQFKSPVTCYDINTQGQWVNCGDVIGYADNTGLSTGDHLHFGLKPVAINENLGTYYNPLQNNGYAGAIDSAPYFNGRIATDCINLRKQVSILGSIVELLKKIIYK